MPPSGGNKRKRGDRNYSEDDGARPSPHRPGNLDLARNGNPHSPNTSRDGGDGYGRGRGNFRRGSRGGRYQSGPGSPTMTIPERRSPVAKPQQIPTPVQMPVPPPAIVAPEPPAEPEMQDTARPFVYTLLSEQLLDSWNEEGRETAQTLVNTTAAAEDYIELSMLIQELIYAACAKKIPAQEAGVLLKDMISADEAENVPTEKQRCLLDATSIAFDENSTLPASVLSTFFAATGIDEDLLRLELDQALLSKLGLIGMRFKQVYVKKQTNILYRQANFNLLREESEGFAKLITELFITSGTESPTHVVVQDTVERVKAMIGAFDLDVGRSLDVVLDVFGSVLVRHFRFLVKLLRASPWWPQNSEQVSVGGLPYWAEASSSDTDTKLENAQQIRERDNVFWDQAKSLGLVAFQRVGRTLASGEIDETTSSTDDFRHRWIKETGTLPPNGNHDAAQLLGFKLRFYSSSAAREPSNVLPDNLVHLSALLIKIGFISLGDLYPHIWRWDEEMEELKQRKMKEKEERDRAARPGAGTRNALAMAGALADDTLPAPAARLRETGTRASTPAKDSENEKTAQIEEKVEAADQKVMLLKSLLAVGALPEALFILGRFPWVMDLYPELPEYIHRILHHCLSDVYETIRPLQARDSLRQQRPMIKTDVSDVVKGQIKLTNAPVRRTLKWAKLDQDDSGDGTDYRFYWDDWNDNIPRCQDVDDVFTLCKTLLTLVGVKIGQDPTLLLKISRIGRHSLDKDPSDENKARWLDLIRRVILPAVSLTKSNAGVVNQVYELISQYPTNTRYVMYLEWLSGRTSRVPDMKAAFDQARAETKTF